MKEERGDETLQYFNWQCILVIRMGLSAAQKRLPEAELGRKLYLQKMA